MRPTAAVSLIAMLALSAAACSLPASETADEAPAGAPPASAPPASAPVSAPASDPPDPATTAAPSASTAAAPTPADPNQPAAGDQLGQVVATRTSASDGKKVQLRLYPVVRDQTTSHVNLTLSAGSPTSSDRVGVGRLLGDGNSEQADRGPWTADGIQLIDAKNSKLYLVASAGEGNCVCSRSLLNVSLEKGAPVLISATFAAPPADVTTVDVQIPNFGTVKNVPVQ